MFRVILSLIVCAMVGTALVGCKASAEVDPQGVSNIGR